MAKGFLFPLQTKGSYLSSPQVKRTFPLLEGINSSLERPGLIPYCEGINPLENVSFLTVQEAEKLINYKVGSFLMDTL